MAIGTATAIGLGASALGSFMRARGQSKQNKQFQGMMGQASPLEMWGQGMLMGGSGWNMGQDPLMQSMRRDPRDQSAYALQGIIQNQGNPYDTTALFDALQARNDRNLAGQVADLQASAPGLGARFGGAMRTAETNLRAQALEAMALQNAQIGMQSHADAQGRLLQALGLQQQGAIAGNQQQAALLQLLLGAQSNRLGLNAQLMGQTGGSPWGQFFGDLGSAAILPNLFSGRAGAAASSQMMGGRY